MSNTDFLLLMMGPVMGFLFGLVVFFIGRHEQRRYFAAHPDRPNPFERKHAPHHTPAE